MPINWSGLIRCMPCLVEFITPLLHATTAACSGFDRVEMDDVWYMFLNVNEGFDSVDPAEHISLFTDQGLARSILTGSLVLLDLLSGDIPAGPNLRNRGFMRNL